MSTDAPVWDEATVEKVAEAVEDVAWLPEDDYFERSARAALSVLPDPTADTVLLAKVREQWAIFNSAGWIDQEPTKLDALNTIAALLTGES